MTRDLSAQVWVLLRPSFASWGGVESIISELVEYLTKFNARVVVITNELGGAEYVMSACQVIRHVWGHDCSELKSELAVGTHENTTILSFDPASLALAFALASDLSAHSNTVRLAHGVFHPRDFRRENEKWHIHLLNKILGYVVGLDKMYFMNEVCRSSHCTIWPNAVPREDNIINIPIKPQYRRWSSEKRDSIIKICSVGRVVPFKAYNFSSIDIIKDFDRNYEVSRWDIFGHGSHVKDLRKNIEADGDGRVTFRGALPVSEFNEVVGQYDLFIGMGMAAIQAAMIGVPTICALEGSADDCLGFFDQVPFGIVGEIHTDVKRYPLRRIIRRYLDLDEHQRAELSERGRSAALRYSTERFFDQIDEFAVPVRASVRQWIRGRIALAYVMLIGDSGLRRFLASGKRLLGA